jgi:hypothetical protein
MFVGTTAQGPAGEKAEGVMQAAETFLREHGVIDDIRRVVIEGRVTGVLIESPTEKTRE